MREVCDAVLYDKKIKGEKRLERAQALVVIGEMFAKVRPLPPLLVFLSYFYTQTLMLDVCDTG